MKKFLITCVFVLMLGNLCSCGADDVETQTREKTDASDFHMSDNVSDAEKEEGQWNSVCSQVKEDLKKMEYISSVEIIPEEYDDYIIEEKVIIICYGKEGEDIPEDAEKSIVEYIDLVNYFSSYQVEIR